MGYEYRVRFEPNTLDPGSYEPDEFLRRLPETVTSLACTVSQSRSYEYRPRSTSDAWPAVVVTVEPDGFFVLENDRRVGTALLGALVRYALGFAKDERVTIESV